MAAGAVDHASEADATNPCGHRSVRATGSSPPRSALVACSWSGTSRATVGHKRPTIGPGRVPEPARRGRSTAGDNRNRRTAGFHYVAVSQGGCPDDHGGCGASRGRQTITLSPVTAGSSSPCCWSEWHRLLPGQHARGRGSARRVAATPRASNKVVSVVSGDGPYSVFQPGSRHRARPSKWPLTPNRAQGHGRGGVTATRISGIVPPDNGLPAGTGSLDIAPSTDLPITYTSTVSVRTASGIVC